jgi:hypothetical protein
MQRIVLVAESQEIPVILVGNISLYQNSMNTLQTRSGQAHLTRSGITLLGKQLVTVPDD